MRQSTKTYEGSPCHLGHTTRYLNGNCRQCALDKEAIRRASKPKKPARRNLPDKPRVCNYCETLKPPSEYYVTKRGYLMGDCKPCRVEQAKSRRRIKRLLVAKTLGKPIDSVIR